MFNFLVSASLRNRLAVLAVALAMVAYGAFVLPRVPIDVFPDLNRPTVTLMTEAEGLAPQEVEQLVTYPLETTMNGMPASRACGRCRASGCRSCSSSSTGAWTSTRPGSS